MIDHHAFLLKKIEKKIPLSDLEKDHLITAFTLQKCSKNDYLIRSGETAHYLYFLLDGFVRCFTQDEEGNEITTELIAPRNLFTAFESFTLQNSSSAFLQCLTDCSYLRISKNKYEELFSTIPQWSVFCRSVYDGQLIRDSKRKSILQSMNAKERYNYILENDPELALHVPVKYLASYLGIQPQSLSRIRKEF